MADNWLDLKNSLESGAASLPKPQPNSGCGTSTSGTNVDLGLPSLSEVTSDVNATLSNIQGEIDNFGSEVMGVLRDIGAWIPPELQGSGRGTAPENTVAGAVADVTKVTTTTSQQGGLIQQEGINELTGDTFWQIRNSAGAGFRIDPNGSVIVSSVKNPSTDPNTGNFSVSSDGPAVIKINEFLAIEVNNDNDALAAENPSVKGAAVSLVINGNMNIEVRNGDVAVKSAGNLSLTAAKSLELRGSDIKLLAGGGPGSDKKNPSEEYGGLIDLRCGSYNNSASTKQEKESAKFSKISGEHTILMDDPRSILNIESAGDLDISVARNMLETIGGKKVTSVLNALPGSNILSSALAGAPPTPPLITAAAGYTIQNKYKDTTPSATSTDPINNPLLLIENDTAAAGGITCNITQGDIVFSTKIGNFAIGNSKSVVADIVTPLLNKTLAPSLVKVNKPGMYVGSDAADLAVFGKGSLILTAGAYTPGSPPANDYVWIKPGTINALAAAIYLN